MQRRINNDALLEGFITAFIEDVFLFTRKKNYKRVEIHSRRCLSVLGGKKKKFLGRNKMKSRIFSTTFEKFNKKLNDFSLESFKKNSKEK